MKSIGLVFALLLAPFSATSIVAQTLEALIGTSPDSWTASEWLNADDLELTDLQGSVVLVRFWTAPQCPYCRASAPALVEWNEEFAEEGLQVIGMYHHKSATPMDLSAVARSAKSYGFEFPIGVDAGWTTLRRWWLTQIDGPAWTSVSFLLDRQGVIRHIHPGGQYVKGDNDYTEMKNTIVTLLAEN